MKAATILGICLALTGCASKSGIYGVDVKGGGNAPSNETWQASNKSWNELAECIYEDASDDDGAGAVHYTEFSSSKMARIYYDATAQGLFTTAHNRIWDMEVRATDKGSEVHIAAAKSLFGNYLGEAQESVDKCK